MLLALSHRLIHAVLTFGHAGVALFVEELAL